MIEDRNGVEINGRKKLEEVLKVKRSRSSEEKREKTRHAEFTKAGKIQASFTAALLLPAALFHLSSKVQMMPDFSDPASLQKDPAGLPLNHPLLMKHTNYPN